MRWRRGMLVVAVVLVAFGLPSCGDDAGSDGPGNAGIANPASQYCIERGGDLEIVTGEDGGEIGMCSLPDGRVIEEWELWRTEGPGAGSGEDPAAEEPDDEADENDDARRQAAAECAEQDGEFEAVDGEGGLLGRCTLPNGDIRYTYAL